MPRVKYQTSRDKPKSNGSSPTRLSRHHEVRVMRLSDLKPADYNPRTMTPEAAAGLTESLSRFGLVDPLIVNKRTGYTIVGGHQRYSVMEQQGIKEAQVILVDLSEAEERALNVTLNNKHIAGDWNNDQLVSLLDQIKTDGAVAFDELLLDRLLSDLIRESERSIMPKDEAFRTLAQRFGVPPFSVLDARQGYWQDRKRAWIGLGIVSEIGRGENLLSLSAACNLQQKGKAYK